jgi:hypothetical protein
MENQLFECIKGYATETNIVCMQGDVVKIIDMEEGWVTLEGVAGYCEGIMVDFAPSMVVEHFKSIHLKYSI